MREQIWPPGSTRAYWIVNSRAIVCVDLAGVASETTDRAMAFAIDNVARLAKGEQLMAVVPPVQDTVTDVHAVTMRARV